MHQLHSDPPASEPQNSMRMQRGTEQLIYQHRYTMVKTPKPSCSHKIRSTKRPLVGQPSVKHERRKVQTNQPIFPGTSLSHLFTNPSKHHQATSLALNSFQDAAHQCQQDSFHPYQGLSPKYPACYLAARAGML